MNKWITLQLTPQEAVFLIGFKALPKALTAKVVTAIQAAGEDSTSVTAPVKRTRNRKPTVSAPLADRSEPAPAPFN